jgi:hypothetical protein
VSKPFRQDCHLPARDFMHRGRLTLATVLAALLLLCASNGFAQQPGTAHAGAPGSAQGNLTVTATVVASVGVAIGADGEQRLIFANAADPSDNVSHLQPVRTVALTSNPGSPAVDNAPKKNKKH